MGMGENGKLKKNEKEGFVKFWYKHFLKRFYAIYLSFK
jgi:hypothetical protein